MQSINGEYCFGLHFNDLFKLLANKTYKINQLLYENLVLKFYFFL